jgi:hypothetical protein
MAQETRNRLNGQRYDTRRPEPDEVQLDRWERDTTYVLLAALVNALAGVIAILAPWLTGYGTGDERWAPIVAGIVMIVAAAGRIAVPDLTRTFWTAVPVLAGVFLIAAAIWLTEGAGPALSDAVCGIGAILIALLTMDSGETI